MVSAFRRDTTFKEIPMKKSESISNLAKALIAATRQIDSKVLKNALNDSLGVNYADLGAIIDAIKAPLFDAGIVVVQSPTASSNPQEISLTTVLLHETGEWLEDTLTCPLVFQDPQGFGSAISYVRRYCLGSMLLLYSADDDGQEATRRVIDNAQQKGSPETVAAPEKRKAPSDASLPPDVQKRVDSWLNTIKNASLSRLETSRTSAKTTFAGKAFEIVDRAFDVRIAALRAAARQTA
jgi:hypothetical protein